MSIGQWLEQTRQALERNGFEVHVHATPEQAVPEILARLPAGASIGRCGSVTVERLGLWSALADRGHPILDPYVPGFTNEQKEAVRRQTQHADVLLTGTNAITTDGHLVNIDGVGNRVSAQIFGPRQVVIVAGWNKIVAGGVPAALARIKQVACPQNARRLDLDTPCARDLPCPPPDGCCSPRRMCNAVVILERRPRLTPIRIHLVAADLGY